MIELQLSPAGRRYGYIEDHADHRDLGMMSAPFRSPTFLARAFDLESFCGPVLDQGAEGSCTAHFGVGLRGFLSRKFENVVRDFSPAYVYWLSLQTDAFYEVNDRWPTTEELLAFAKTNAVQDVGSMGRTVCWVLNKFGACTIGSEPYVPGQFATPPTDAQLAEGLSFKGGAYHRLATVADMKSCLASGYVFGIGFTVYESFEHIGDNGQWNPKTDENVLGRHQVMAIGYDDTLNGGSLKIRNSWGPNWGQRGNFWMKYTDAANPDILMDAWMEHLGKAWG